MTFDDWCAAHGGYLNDNDDAAKAAKLRARQAWGAAVAEERERRAKIADEHALPLPKTEYTLASGFAVSRMPGYSADQMRAYAAAAVAGPDRESERAALNRAPLDDAQALALARQHLDKGLSWAPHIVRCTDLEVRALIRAVEAAHGIGA